MYCEICRIWKGPPYLRILAKSNKTYAVQFQSTVVVYIGNKKKYGTFWRYNE